MKISYCYLSTDTCVWTIMAREFTFSKKVDELCYHWPIGLDRLSSSFWILLTPFKVIDFRNVKMQHLHFRIHAKYFLLPWKIPEEISRWAMLFYKGRIYHMKHIFVHTTFYCTCGLSRNLTFNGSIYYVLFWRYCFLLSGAESVYKFKHAFVWSSGSLQLLSIKIHTWREY